MFSKPYDSYTDILNVIIEQLHVFHFSDDIHHSTCHWPCLYNWDSWKSFIYTWAFL